MRLIGAALAMEGDVDDQRNAARVHEINGHLGDPDCHSIIDGMPAGFSSTRQPAKQNFRK
jgi:hypothetical protein